MRAESAPFSLHRRSGLYYIQFKNPITHEWTNAKSAGTTDRNTALLTVSEWMRDGVPVDKTGTRCRLDAIFTAESVIESARSAELTTEEAARIVNILKDRGLVDVSAVCKGPGEVDFIALGVRMISWTVYDANPIRNCIPPFPCMG